MAPRLPIPPAATPSQTRKSTTARRDSGFTVPATPSRLTEPRSRNNLGSSGLERPSTSDDRIGHTALGFSPLGTRTFATSKVSESKANLDPRILKEMVANIVQVETNAFLRAALYKDTATMEADRTRAAKYLTLPQIPSPHKGRAGGDPTDSSPQQSTIPSPTTSQPTKSTPERRPSAPDVPTHQSPLPPCDTAVREEGLYPRYVELLNSVSQFFRAEIKDVDDAWHPAQPPDIPPACQNAGPPLRRVFRDTHREVRSFSRYKYGQGGLKPDMCLLLAPEDMPKKAEGKPKKTKGKPKKTEGKPKKTKRKPKRSKPKSHWKDVLVPIEVKKKSTMGTADLLQMAHYARSVMVEQFDRNFVFSVLLTGDVCRVFHWDVVGAQVTRFSIRENLPLFIQVMGRLATMTPSELGYDTHFSNAGRVRSTDIIDTRLTIHLSEPRPFFHHTIQPPTPERPDNKPSLVVHLTKMLFESTSGLFSRATRVWKAVAVNDPLEAQQWSKGETYIVKQNWADDKRPNEGLFHALAKDVVAVPRLLGMEELEFTSSFRARFDPKEVLGVLLVRQAKQHDRAGPGVDDSDDSDQDSCREDMSADGEGSDPASADDEGAGGDLSATDVGDEEDVSDEEDEENDSDKEDLPEEDLRAGEDVVANIANAGNKQPLERVLLRFVFKGEGRSLKEAEDSIELLRATQDWTQGLLDLSKVGITHRDISYGNLLLPLSSDGTGRASIIDLGLSLLDDPKRILEVYPAEDIEGLPCSEPHHHVTGTLPFVAVDLLDRAESNEPCKHELHHDIESIFWVLLYTCIKHHDGQDTVFGSILRGLTYPSAHEVLSEKVSFYARKLHVLDDEIGGTYNELAPFLKKFAGLCFRTGRVVTALEVISLVLEELDRLEKEREPNGRKKGRKRKLENLPEHDPAPVTKKNKQRQPLTITDD